MTTSPTDNMPPGLTDPFQLGEWLIDPGLDRISRNGEEVRLEPRVMKVLTLLAAQPGSVLSREQLEAGAWGNVIVGYDSLSGCINKLRKALGDNTHNPSFIETVSKKGYRLVAPVSAAPDGNDAVEQEVLEAGGGKFSKPVVLLIAAVLVVGLAAVIGLSVRGVQTGGIVSEIQADKRIAVLPFANLSGDARQDHFVEGVTDDLITDLSNLSGILVISRSASSQFKSQKYNPGEVGAQLGADYLLEGSVRKTGADWRMNVKLINVADGTNLWAQRFNHTDSELLGVQDLVVRRIVETLSLKLSKQDERRLNNRPATNFEAYELFLQGQKQFKERTKEANQSARDSYRQAIRLDPNFARAYGALAVALDVDYFRGWSEAPTSTLDRALEMAKYATELDPVSPQAYWALGYTHLFRREERKAVSAVEKAVELAPNYADGYGLLALINNYLGNAEEAAAQIKKGMRLNPHYSWDYPYNLGRAYYNLGQHDKAIETLKLALERNAYARNPRMFLAASYMALGRKEDAQWEVEQLVANSPETTVSFLEKNYPIADDREQLRIFLDRLRQAGLPE